MKKRFELGVGEVVPVGKMKFSKHNKAQVWKCGGGTQSCAIAALIVQGKLPKPDVSVISDTGYETRATWEYKERVLDPELEKVGVTLHRVKASEWNAKRAKLFYDYNDKTRESDLQIPAYSTRFGDGPLTTKLGNFCTGRWKVEVTDKWLSKTHGLTRSQFVSWIGFSRDEQTRIINMQKGEEYKKGLIRFPLLTDWPTTRREAIALVEVMGWPTPPRSACYMCPNKSDNEWRLLRDTRPDEFEKAVLIERGIHTRDPEAWLHKSCVPLDKVDFTKPDDLFSRPCDSGQCFV